MLDSSAVLAHLQNERGKEIVESALAGEPLISSVNLADVATRLQERGATEQEIRVAIDGLSSTVVPFDTDLPYRAGLLRSMTRHLGLSLGDRACLALAQKLSPPVLTTDRDWASLSLGITIQVIR